MRALKQVIGWVLVMGGGFFTVMAVVDLVTGADPDTGPGVLSGLAVFFGAVTVGGVQMLRAARRKPEHAGVPLEVIALREAKAHGGTLGAAQLAAAVGIPLAEARQVLEACVAQGACTVLVDERGLELFRFGELALTPGEAAAAKDLLEG